MQSLPFPLLWMLIHFASIKEKLKSHLGQVPINLQLGKRNRHSSNNYKISIISPFFAKSQHDHFDLD